MLRPIVQMTGHRETLDIKRLQPFKCTAMTANGQTADGLQQSRHITPQSGADLTGEQTIEAFAVQVALQAGKQAHTHVCHRQVIRL